MWLTIAIHTARRDDGNASCPYVVRGLLFSWLTFFFTEKKTEWRSWRERRRTGQGYSGLRCSLRIRTLPVAVSLSPPCLASQAARNRLSDLWKTTAIRTDYTRAVFSSPHPSVSSQSAGRIGPRSGRLQFFAQKVLLYLLCSQGTQFLVQNFSSAVVCHSHFILPSAAGEKGRGHVSVRQPHVFPQVRN